MDRDKLTDATIKLLTESLLRKKQEAKETNSWFGVEGAKYISRGSWSDPQVSYKGYLYNYWDISDFVYECMVEDYRESGKKLPAENTPEYEELFNEYMEKEVPNALFDLQPQELDPSVMDFIEYGQQIRGVVNLIKFADKIVKGYSLEAIEKRLEALKEITNIPDNLINKAINLVKDTMAGTDMKDSFDEDERTDEILPIIKEILSNTDTLFENKQIKTEDENEDDEDEWEDADPEPEIYLVYNGKIYWEGTQEQLAEDEYGLKLMVCDIVEEDTGRYPDVDEIDVYGVKEFEEMFENKQVKTESETSDEHYIAICEMEGEPGKTYLLLDEKSSDGMGGLDIILARSAFGRLWYNTDLKVKGLKIIKTVKNLDELIAYMKEKGIDLSSMVTKKGIPVGMSDMLSFDLYHYVVGDEASDPELLNK